MQKLKILYEDKYIIVVYKKSNYLTIATDSEKYNTLYNEVMEYEKKKNKNNKIFIVHRLDKDTEGIVLFAKNREIKDKLQDNWNNVIRKYYAIVIGKTKDEDTIKSYLKETKTLYTYSSNSGKEAITKYKKIKSNDKYTLLDIQILTGRKNQIRVHMKDNNTPILGDNKYGIKNTHKKMYLCAYYLKFNHPFNNNIIEIKLDLPKDYNINK